MFIPTSMVTALTFMPILFFHADNCPIFHFFSISDCSPHPQKTSTIYQVLFNCHTLFYLNCSDQSIFFLFSRTVFWLVSYYFSMIEPMSFAQFTLCTYSLPYHGFFCIISLIVRVIHFLCSFLFDFFLYNSFCF